jgi:uncharacterized protein YbjQ (UPF0145 family)
MSEGPWSSTSVSEIIVTTTHGIDGRPVQHYLGIVSGEVISGANIFRDFMAGIRDIVGGRSVAYEEVLEDARQKAISEMRGRAAKIGANAVVGVDIDYEVIGKGGSMLMVSATGTAVII